MTKSEFFLDEFVSIRVGDILKDKLSRDEWTITEIRPPDSRSSEFEYQLTYRPNSVPAIGFTCFWVTNSFLINGTWSNRTKDFQFNRFRIIRDG